MHTFPCSFQNLFSKKKHHMQPDLSQKLHGLQTLWKENVLLFGQHRKQLFATAFLAGLEAIATCRYELTNGVMSCDGKQKQQNYFCGQENFFGKKAIVFTLL